MKKQYLTPELKQQLIKILDTLTASDEVETGPHENGYAGVVSIFNWDL